MSDIDLSGRNHIVREQAPDWAEEAARRALPAYGLSAESTLQFVKHRENTVFRAATPHDGDYAVRLHRPGHRRDSQIRAELDFARRLQAHGVRTIRAIPRVPGESDAAGADTPDSARRTSDLLDPVTVETPEGPTQVVVMEWVVDSRPIGSVESGWTGGTTPDLTMFTAVGRLAAEAHLAASEIGPSAYDRPTWDAAGFWGPDAVWGDPGTLDHPGAGRLAEATAGVRQRLTRAPHDDWFGPIHADFTPENILTGPEGLTLIDFDDCATGWHLFDLATILFWHHRHPDAARQREALLAGYTQIRPIPAEHLALLDDLILARGCTYLGWAAARRGDEDAEFIVDHVAGPVTDMALSLATR
ncbi:MULTISPECIES: phosphotransferase enzyme family protein [Actinomycetes]|uniref:Phosphotransferase n=2 Tax=Actinomycetes TaxID=1760 RepID=A0ABP6LZ80_9MICC